MIGTLIDYNRQMNRVFGASVDIQVTARALGESTFEMELLANNGVARAAGLPSGEGGALLTLASFLAGIPDRIRPEVGRIDAICEGLASSISICSNRVRTYYQVASALLATHRRLTRASENQSGDSSDGGTGEVGLQTPAGVERLLREIENASASERERINSRALGELSARSRREIRDHLDEALRILHKLGGRLAEIRNISIMARYLAQHVAVEAAYLGSERKSFDHFAADIHETVDHLNEVVAPLAAATRDGEQLLASLARQLEAA